MAGDDEQTPTDRPSRRGRSQPNYEADRKAAADRQRKFRDQLEDLAAESSIPVHIEHEDTRPELDLSPSEELLWNRVTRLKQDMRRSKSDSANSLLEAMGKRPPAERFTRLETRVKIIWAILAAVGACALGAAITVAKGLYERGETDGAHEIRLQQVERAVDHLERYFFPVDEIRRAYRLPPSKDTTPHD